MRAPLLILAAAAFAGMATLAVGAPAPVRYVDAHSHFADGASTVQNVEQFRKAGVDGVVFMFPNTEVLTAAAKANPGYVIPFNSIARTPEMTGMRLDAQAASKLGALYDSGQICGFGEIPTRIEQRAEANDAAAIGNSFRAQVFDAAASRGAPVNIHISFDAPETAVAFGQAVGAHPRTPVILAHAGWVAGPDVVGKLLADHSNLFTDVSIRLQMPTGRPNDISILTADGALQPEWKALIERFPDRFLFAMDVSGLDTNNRIPGLMATARKALGALPRPVEEAVAHGNIERLVQSCKVARS